MISENTSNIPLIYKEVTVTAPSNIAIVKYWGKHGVQLPRNPSVSLTLSKSITTTTVRLEKDQSEGMELYFEGKRNSHFEPKIQQYLSRNKGNLSFLSGYKIIIESENSFPHSSGIASSASSMAALSTAFYHLTESSALNNPASKRLLSEMSRLGSGSACRSIYGPWASWGALSAIPDSSNKWASPLIDVHPIFHDYRNAILIVNKEQKSVSSTIGHKLMNQHPYAEKRFEQARSHADELVEVLRNGNVDQFIEICETEALELHALMMMSRPYFILLKPNTLKIITKLKSFRSDTGIPVAFTCDAGPNVHILYPNSYHDSVYKWVNSELLEFCQERKVIWDAAGNGPKLLAVD